MNEVETLLAAKTVKQLQGRMPVSSSDAEDLITSLTADKNSLHLRYNKAYFDEDRPINEMTIEEYSAYVEDRISCFIIHPQQRRVNYTIHITEKGLFAMKSDRNYQKYVLSVVQAAFGQPYYSPFSENCLLYFDDRENSCSMSWSSMKGIKPEPHVMTASKEESENLFDMHADAETEIDMDKEYIFSRISPVSVLIPSSRYARALYAYNVAPADWLKGRKRGY